MKPALGYRSRTEAVSAMLAEGLDIPDIALRLGIDRKKTASLVYMARHREVSSRRAATSSLTVPREVQSALMAPAVRRGMTPLQLAERILRTVATERLVDAVLDDADEPAPRVAVPAAA